jgi:hypothetical protein
MGTTENISLKDVSQVRITPAKFRELALAKLLTSGPGEILAYMPTPSELENMADMLSNAITAGRFIDFGFWTNEFIRSQSGRAANLYYEDALGHPFTSPWIFFHTWSDPIVDEKFNIVHESCSAYLVNPFPNENGKAINCDTEIVAVEVFNIGGKTLLGVGDRGVLHTGIVRVPGSKYVCNVIPVQFRFPQHFWDSYAELIGGERGPEAALNAAAANIMEPLFIALMLLNTRGIAKETVRASDKLNKARIKNNKPIIPPYTKVKSAEYITAIMRTSREKGPSKDGHHASPVAHLRIGHWRHYKTGEKTFINDTLVNSTPEMRELFKSSRTGYIVKE